MEPSTIYSFAKSLHLVGMVSWFAGMFYLVRIFVNHAESNRLEGPEKDFLQRRFSEMETKVYRVIMAPAVVLTWTFGCVMLSIQPIWLEQPWMRAKLACLVLLTGYHHFCKRWMRQLQDGTSTFAHVHFRALNEVPTLFLVAIVFLAVFKDRTNFWFLALGLGAMTALIASAIRKVARKNGL